VPDADRSHCEWCGTPASDCPTADPDARLEALTHTVVGRATGTCCEDCWHPPTGGYARGGVIGGPTVRRAEWIEPLPPSPALRSALGCDLPPAPPLITVTLRLRFCDCWDFIDWHAVLFPRSTRLVRGWREAGRRLRLVWKAIRWGY
jgi:hypothetical protein